MRQSFILFSIILFWSFAGILAAENIPDSQDTPNKAGVTCSFKNIDRYQTSVGYWNDNVIFQDILRKAIEPGEDDYVTASFWLQIAFDDYSKWWFLDIYHNILTNKTGNYRTDLFSVRLSIEKATALGSFKLGSGIISNGNFGGKILQNGYHKMRGIADVQLPYVKKESTGMIAFFKYQPELWYTEHFRFNGYVSNSYRTTVGPSNFRTGILCDVITHSGWESYTFHLQTNTGYIDYYRSGRYLSPLFDNGFTWGVLVSGGRIDKFVVATWITDNQYGLKQPHFGISITFGWNGTRMSDLNDISFP